jgi:beta-phosphoglucomutase-like phosphatase (HAD superfamily)
MIKAVIFDCDGVLVDSVGLAGEVLAEYLSELGFEVTRHEATRRIRAGIAAGMQVFAFLPGGGETAHAGVRTLRRLSELHEHLPAP